MDSPYLFALGIPPNHTVDDRRFTCLSMGVFFADGIDFDVF